MLIFISYFLNCVCFPTFSDFEGNVAELDLVADIKIIHLYTMLSLMVLFFFLSFFLGYMEASVFN